MRKPCTRCAPRSTRQTTRARTRGCARWCSRWNTRARRYVAHAACSPPSPQPATRSPPTPSAHAARQPVMPPPRFIAVRRGGRVLWVWLPRTQLAALRRTHTALTEHVGVARDELQLTRGALTQAAETAAARHHRASSRGRTTVARCDVRRAKCELSSDCRERVAWSDPLVVAGIRQLEEAVEHASPARSRH
jgi:hypothetical protein